MRRGLINARCHVQEAEFTERTPQNGWATQSKIACRHFQRSVLESADSSHMGLRSRKFNLHTKMQNKCSDANTVRVSEKSFESTCTLPLAMASPVRSLRSAKARVSRIAEQTDGAKVGKSTWVKRYDDETKFLKIKVKQSGHRFSLGCKSSCQARAGKDTKPASPKKKPLHFKLGLGGDAAWQA